MPSYINTNITSLVAQRNLDKSGREMSTSLERLSSGLRINSAKDDAAGLAISLRMSSQIEGLTVGARNANDGISLAQTAEGAMGEITDMLLRMRELSVQSASDSNTAADRSKLNSEMKELYSEIDRIAGTTTFNTRSILNGGANGLKLQVGASANQTITLDIGSVTTKSMSLNGFSGLGSLNSGRVSGTTSTASDITLNGIIITTASGVTAASSASALNNQTSATGVTATAYNSISGGAATGITSGTFTINGDTVAASSSMDELVDNINRDAAGVTASLDSSGNLVVSNDTGNNIIITNATGTGLSSQTTYLGYVSLTHISGDSIELALNTPTTASAADLNSFGFNTAGVDGSGNNFVKGGDAGTAAVSASDLITVNGVRLGASVDGSAATKAEAINAISTDTNVQATALTEVKGLAGVSVTGVVAGTGDAVINGVDLFTVTGAIGSMSELVNVINYSTVGGSSGSAAIAGVTASTVDGKLVLTSNLGIDVTASGTDLNLLGLTASTTTGQLTLTSTNGGDVLLGSDLTTESEKVAALAKLGVVGQGGNDNAVKSGLDITTQQNANTAIKRIDSALDYVSDQRANIGAVQNRLSIAVSVSEVQTVNVQAAKQAIVDADFAAVTGDLTRAQILQQAGTFVLSQANKMPQSVLSLLQ